MEGRPVSGDGSWTAPDLEVRALSSAELLALDDEGWLIERRLPVPGTSLIVAEPGAGAGVTFRRLALAVARGTPWLGLPTRRGRALYVDPVGRIGELRLSFARLGLRPSDDVHVLAAPMSPDLLDAILDRARAIDPTLVVIDPIAPLLRTEEGVERPEASGLDRVLDIARHARAHLMLVHRRGSERAAEMRTTLASAGRKLDAVLELTREAGRSRLRTLPPGEVTEPEDPAGLEARILELLRSAGRLVARDEIVARTGARRDRVLEALLLLRQRGSVLRVGAGTAHDPHLYTGCDVASGGQGGWLRRVRPWARLSSGARGTDPRRPAAQRRSPSLDAGGTRPAHKRA